MYCEKCGSEIEEGVQFCSFCAAKINEENKSTCEKINKTDAANNEKYSVKEMTEKIGKLITGGLSVISLVMLVGAFLGFFDKDPIPFIIFIGIIILFGKLEDKFTKVPTIVFAVLEIIALVLCFNIANDAGAVVSVKGGSPNSYPNITYEEAFEDYFSDPTWKNVGKDEDGNEVVKFTGNCYYLDKSAVAEIKFTVYKDQGSFVVSSVKINGQDMELLGNVMVMNVFEEYEQSH